MHFCTVHAQFVSHHYHYFFCTITPLLYSLFFYRCISLSACVGHSHVDHCRRCNVYWGSVSCIQLPVNCQLTLMQTSPRGPSKAKSTHLHLSPLVFSPLLSSINSKYLLPTRPFPVFSSSLFIFYLVISSLALSSPLSHSLLSCLGVTTPPPRDAPVILPQVCTLL